MVEKYSKPEYTYMEEILYRMHCVVTHKANPVLEYRIKVFLQSLFHDATAGDHCPFCERKTIDNSWKDRDKIDWKARLHCPLCLQQIDSPGA
jgi:hypothetical protein